MARTLLTNADIRFLQALTLAIAAKDTFKEAIKIALQEIVAFAGWSYAEAWIPVNSHHYLQCAVTCSPSDKPKLVAFANAAQTIKFSPGIGLPGRVWRARKSEWMPDVSQSEKALFFRIDAALTAGLKAAFGVPIIVGSQVLAVLVFFCQEAHGEQSRLIQLVEAIANQIAVVLQWKQTEAALLKRERYLATLVDIQRHLLACKGHRQELYNSVLERLGRVSGASRVYIFENHIDFNHCLLMSQKSEWCAPGIKSELDNPFLQNLPYDFFSSQMEATLRAGEAYSGIVAELPNPERAFLSSQQVLSILILPLTVNGQPFGLIGFSNCLDEQAWESSEIDLLRSTATTLSLAIEELQVEEALRESERRYRLLAEHSTDIISRHTSDGIYTYVSPACHSLLGYQAEALLGKSINNLVHPADILRVRQAYRNGLACTHPTVFSYRIQHQDGHYIWLETISRCFVHHESAPGQLLDDKTQPSPVREIISVSRDITTRKQVEGQLANKRKVLELIVRGASLAETLGSIVKSIEARSLHLKASVVLLDKDGTRLWHAAAPSLSKEYVRAVDSKSIGPTSGSCGTAIHRQQPVIVSDIATDSLWDRDRHLALEQGLRACWSVPILSTHGKSLGSLAVYHMEPKSPTADDWEMIEAAAQLASIAIEQKQSDQALREAEEKYRSIVENAVEGIFQTTLEGQYITVNPMLAKIYGYKSPAELKQCLTNITQQLYVQPQRRVEFVQLMQAHYEVRNFESQVYRKDGSIIWISESVRVIQDEAGKILGYEGTVEDITERKQTELMLQRQDSLLRGVAKASSCLLEERNFDKAINKVLAALGESTTADRVYLYQNHPHPATGGMLMSMHYEWTAAGILPSIHQPHWQNHPYADGFQRWYDRFSGGNSVNGLTQDMPDSERVILQLDGILAILMVPIFVGDSLWGYIGFDDCCLEQRWSANEESILVAIASNIGATIERLQAEDQMRHQAFHDTLTGLPNRSLFNDRLPQAIAHAKRTNKMLAVLFMDLDRFKVINDTLGHAVGDQLLKAATERLTGCLREEDTLARWGGDEFTLLLPQIDSQDDAARVALRILQVLRPPFQLSGYELHITSSIGIALYPQDGDDLQVLVKNADAALYRVKDQGRNNYQFYNVAFNSQASKLLHIEQNLHYALQRGELTLYYQPQFNVETGRITQVEALIRWNHPTLGLISPSTFIPLAEETGLIVPMGEWVLRTGCAQLREWQQMDIPDLRLAVNLSGRQFQEPGLLALVEDILAKTHVDANALELEITETTAMRQVDVTRQLLYQLRHIGVQVAIDDFGIGYASLSYLKSFPVDTVKIDQSFVQDLSHDPQDRAIITAIIALGRGLGVRLVAEGVETQAQVDCLRSLNCHEMQGYLFSQPLPPEALTTLLLQQHHTTEVSQELHRQ